MVLEVFAENIYDVVLFALAAKRTKKGKAPTFGWGRANASPNETTYVFTFYPVT